MLRRTGEAGMLKHWEGEDRKENLRLTEANFCYNPEYAWPAVVKVATWAFMGHSHLPNMS